MATTESVWEEYLQLTRLYKSARLAFDREELLCSSLIPKSARNVILTSTDGPSTYRISLEKHLAALKNERLLSTLILSGYYSLSESFARAKLGLGELDSLQGGIEAWGAQLLAATGNDWSQVHGGKAGLIEVAVVRNALVHSLELITQADLNRFQSSQCMAPWPSGSPVVLTYDLLQEYRARLRSLMRLGHKRRIATLLNAAN